jgi:hypothetical protein
MAVMAMVAVVAFLVAGMTGCAKKKDAWEDYVGVWNDGGGWVTATGSRMLAWQLTVHGNGNVTFGLETTSGGWWTATDEEVNWSGDSLVYDGRDTDGDTIRVVVNFITGNQATWSATGNINWCPVSGTLSR